MDDMVLFAVARSGNVALLHKLLAKGSRPCFVRPWHGGDETAITVAIRVKAWDCVNLILEYCEPDAELSLPGLKAATMGPGSQFRILFHFIDWELSKSRRTNLDNETKFLSQFARSETLASCIVVLGLFLQAGVNVDLPYFLPDSKPGAA